MYQIKGVINIMVIENGTYSVYVHINTINNKVYVGTTSKVPAYKRWCIASGAGYRRNKRFYSDIQEYGWENFEHEIIAFNLTKDEASNMERILIEKLNSTNPDYGYNTESHKSLPKEEERIKKISNTLRSGNHGMRGKHVPEERKQKIREAMLGEKGYWYGKKLPPETIKKMSEALKDRKIETERYLEFCKEISKPVMCIETGERYESISSAAKILGVSHVPISRAVNGKQTTAYGKHWKFI